MKQDRTYHGGLVFLGDNEGALEHFSRIATATLEDYGHLVERQTLLNAREARVVSNQYLVRLRLEADEPQPEDRHQRLDRTAGLNAGANRNRLVISMTPVSDLLDDREISELMLVVMLYRMVDICTSKLVEWLSPATVLTVEQFMGAFANLSPRKVRARQQIFCAISGPFAGTNSQIDADMVRNATHVMGQPPHAGESGPVELSEDEMLALAFRADARPDELDAMSAEDRLRHTLQRATSWCITGVVASLSAPVAISMAAVNLIRGEDFRLNTQVLCYTAALVMLQSSGAIADVGAALGL